MRDSRKKNSKTNPLIVWDIDGKIVKKSLSERLAEEPKITLDEEKTETYLADKYGITEEVFKNFKLFLAGGARDLLWRSNMGHIGNHPQLQKLEKIEQEKLKLKKKELAQRDKLIKLKERELKLAEQSKPDKDSLVTDLCDLITSAAMQANAQAQPSKGKKKSKKPTALGELRKAYPEWCEKNLQFDPKLPTKKNKQYYRTDVLREWEESKQYGYWNENHDVHGWNDPSEGEVTKVYSKIHSKLHINIHDGNLPSEKKTH